MKIAINDEAFHARYSNLDTKSTRRLSCRGEAEAITRRESSPGRCCCCRPPRVWTWEESWSWRCFHSLYVWYHPPRRSRRRWPPAPPPPPCPGSRCSSAWESDCRTRWSLSWSEHSPSWLAWGCPGSLRCRACWVSGSCEARRSSRASTRWRGLRCWTSGSSATESAANCLLPPEIWITIKSGKYPFTIIYSHGINTKQNNQRKSRQERVGWGEGGGADGWVNSKGAGGDGLHFPRSPMCSIMSRHGFY